MHLDDLDFRLPSKLIAQNPAQTPGASKLLQLRRGEADPVADGVFDQLFPSLISPDDVIVINDSRVLHARLHTTRPTGGKTELLLLESLTDADNAAWRVMAKPGKRLKEGMALTCSDGSQITCAYVEEEGTWIVHLPVPLPEVPTWLQRVGELPLPPYIKEFTADPNRYQTVQARAFGSVAAPTASLHLDASMHDWLRSNATVVSVTLHVGAGTFLPVSAATLDEHTMHFERYSVDPTAFQTIAAALAEGRRVVAIGTTVARTLESVFHPDALATIERRAHGGETASGSTNLLIQPGHTWRCVDALLTNFHLPRSTLLALVMSFHGIEQTRAAYRYAIQNEMRFFSFGDAMWIG
jgi:S-adenosylmethionine:tRNA ribosyltransferase-isomerase